MRTIAEVAIMEEYRQGVTNDGRKVIVHSLLRGPSVGGFVCEYEDGTMDELLHKDFRFIDGGQLFGALCWEEAVER